MSGRIEQLRAAGPTGAVRLVARKAVHRRVTMGRYGAAAGAHVAPERPLALTIDLLGPARFHEVAGTNPYLAESDLERFAQGRATCIVAWAGARVAASSWMLGGPVFVSELQRVVQVPSAEHYSCRSFVDPEHRGRALLAHMIYAYARSVPAGDEVWGYVYDWNVASLASLRSIGWQETGRSSTRFVLGRPHAHDERWPARPIVIDPRAARR